MTRTPDFSALKPKAPKTSDVVKTTKAATPANPKEARSTKSKQPLTKDVRTKKREIEPYVDQHLELPQSLRTRFELLFVHSRKLKKKGKNNFLIEAVAAAVKAEEERQ